MAVDIQDVKATVDLKIEEAFAPFEDLLSADFLKTLRSEIGEAIESDMTEVFETVDGAVDDGTDGDNATEYVDGEIDEPDSETEPSEMTLTAVREAMRAAYLAGADAVLDRYREAVSDTEARRV